jgi:hypothetical protein
MDYNEVHPAIGIERNGLEIALTVNSLNRPSVMIAKLSNHTSTKVLILAIALVLALVTSRESCTGMKNTITNMITVGMD